MNPTAPPPIITSLWDRLRATYDRVIAAVGAPAAIALLSLASRPLRLGIVHQLKMLENLARKLLLLEAAAQDQPSEARGPRVVEVPVRGLVVLNQARRKHEPSPARSIDPARPETWPARFALALPRDPRFVPNSRAPRIRALWGPTPKPAPDPAPRQVNHRPAAFLIARRFEALRRVLNDPAPHVRRLAAAQRRACARSPGLIKRYALAAPRCYAYDPKDPRLAVDVYSAVLQPEVLLVDSS